MQCKVVDGFYDNCDIFMTGGSGVVGKAAIEKLLRSCNVKRIFILLRTKRGVPYEKRLEEVKNARIFKVLKECKPNELDKLIAIPGDVGEDGLGISPDHLEQLKNVTIFFHSAASTRFTEPLENAIRMNLKSTYEALKIAKTMKNLKIFLHISTYFSNPTADFIEDKVYPSVMDWRKALRILDMNDDPSILEIVTNKVISGFPNTYIFTKHLAEKLVDDHRTELPVAIYKPSVVISACVEPEVGFCETTTGAMGLLTIMGTGLLQSFLVKSKSSTLDMTPLDVGTKTLLMFTALKGQFSRERLAESTPVGKFSSLAMVCSPIREYMNIAKEASYRYPLEKSFWIPNVTVTTCPFVHTVLVVFCQLIPAFLVDIILRIFRIKPFMMAIQRKIHLTSQALYFFIENESKSDGITDFDEMMEISKGTEFDIQLVTECAESNESVRNLIDKNMRGCRRFLLNEPESSIERCRKILKAKIIVYTILKGLALFFIVRAIYRRLLNDM